MTMSIQRLSGPYWLFSSLGIYCLLQTFGTITDGACSDSFVAGGLQLVAEVVSVSLMSDCLVTYPYLFRGWLGGL